MRTFSENLFIEAKQSGQYFYISASQITKITRYMENVTHIWINSENTGYFEVRRPIKIVMEELSIRVIPHEKFL